jgi:large subunit ribosomal protein L22
MRSSIENSAFAKSSSVKSSVQKINLVAALIRGEKASEALLQLKFCRKKVATDLSQVLLSAIANAENNYGLDIDNLYIERVLVGKSFVLKRFKAKAKGKVGHIRKPYSKITIFVHERS